MNETRQRSLWGRCKRAWRAFAEPLGRKVLPVNCGIEVLKPNVTALIKARSISADFRPERVFVSSAGTAGGSADWLINDIKIGGKSQFVSSGPLPGDMFANVSIDGFVSFDVIEAGVDCEVSVTYVGANPEGCAFYASIIGWEADAGPLDLFREIASGVFHSFGKRIA